VGGKALNQHGVIVAGGETLNNGGTLSVRCGSPCYNSDRCTARDRC
jgi:hypothetical protein